MREMQQQKNVPTLRNIRGCSRGSRRYHSEVTFSWPTIPQRNRQYFGGPVGWTLSNSNVTLARHHHCVRVCVYVCVVHVPDTFVDAALTRVLFLLHHNTRVVLVLHPVSSAVGSLTLWVFIMHRHHGSFAGYRERFRWWTVAIPPPPALPANSRAKIPDCRRNSTFVAFGKDMLALEGMNTNNKSRVRVRLTHVLLCVSLPHIVSVLLCLHLCSFMDRFRDFFSESPFHVYRMSQKFFSQFWFLLLNIFLQGNASDIKNVYTRFA